MNNQVSYSEFRDNLKTHIDNVCDSHNPLLVKRRNGEDVIVVSRNDFESLEETAYLLQSPANAKKLISALKNNSKNRKKFDSIEILKNELGI